MKLEVNAPYGKYDIVFEKNIIGEQLIRSYQNYVVVTDSNVAELYGRRFAAERQMVLEPGEQSKDMKHLEKILAFLNETGIDRDGVVVALGGGVVGDITGLAASLYKRGIQLIQIPTTLLAQVDSSVGGKVAANMPWGKNMIGAFYNPSVVYIDTSVLDSLDKRQYAAGMAEVIKYAYIADNELYSDLCEGNDDIDSIVYRCCVIKKRYVEEDPFDTGARMELNYGHTLGHAIEAAAGYGTFLHGEAVAIGMVYAAMIGERQGVSPKGLINNTIEMLEKYELPSRIEKDLLYRAIELLGTDKKILDGKINFILLEEIGRAVRIPLRINEVAAILKESI